MAFNSKDKSHALCSASGASRWLNCHGSVGLCRDCPAKAPTEYALEGTKAHELAEKMLRRWVRKKPLVPTVYKSDDIEMASHVQSYIGFVTDLYHTGFDSVPMIRFEKKLTLNKTLGMYGTADCVMIGKEAGLWHGKIIDLKYGKSKVVAEENTQLAYYACALIESSKERLESVEVTIYQPRVKNGITEIHYLREDLKLWQGLLKTGAEKALWQAVRPSTRTYTKGSWCKWCEGKNYCPEWNKIEEGAGLEFIEE